MKVAFYYYIFSHLFTCLSWKSMHEHESNTCTVKTAV